MACGQPRLRALEIHDTGERGMSRCPSAAGCVVGRPCSKRAQASSTAQGTGSPHPLLQEHQTRRKRLTLSRCALMITTICYCFWLVDLLKIKVSFFISCFFREIFSCVTGKNKPLLTPLTMANISREGGFLVKDLSCFVLESLCHTQKAIRRRETDGSQNQTPIGIKNIHSFMKKFSSKSL